MRPVRWTWAAVAGGILLLAGIPADALTFEFTYDPGISQEAIDGFAAAGARWSAVLKDDVTIHIQIGFSNLGAGILGQSSAAYQADTYSSTYQALSADQQSADDASAVGHLQSGSAVNLLINRTANSPYGAGSATPYLDQNGNANNTTIQMTTANAKALGLLAANNTQLDGTILLNNAYRWDFNPGDGVNGYDFIGIATHEIGHALGFVSGVDVLDFNSPPLNGPFADSQLAFVDPLDLYRFSELSAAQGPGVIDWTADLRDKYFSLDGGATPLALFSTGTYFGDGGQTSHWKDYLGLGIMDPTAADGETLAISALDLRALDAIGWDLSYHGSAVPEPEAAPLFLLGAVLIQCLRRPRPARSALRHRRSADGA